MPASPTRVTYVGHATILIELGGARILTDPVLRDRVTFLRRQVPPPDFEQLADLDVIAISHAHYDHLDLHSIRQVSGSADVIAPRGAAGLMRRAGVESLAELEVGEGVDAAGIRVEATPADHHGARHPFAKQILSLGYLFKTESAAVYFAGDTDLFDGMGELRGRVDVALIPVAGWGPKVGSGHLDADRAARAVEMIRPRLAVPIHWGTYAAPLYRIPDLSAPPREFAELVAARTPEVEVRVLGPGEATHLT